VLNSSQTRKAADAPWLAMMSDDYALDWWPSRMTVPAGCVKKGRPEAAMVVERRVRHDKMLCLLGSTPKTIHVCALMRAYPALDLLEILQLHWKLHFMALG